MRQSADTFQPGAAGPPRRLRIVGVDQRQDDRRRFVGAEGDSAPLEPLLARVADGDRDALESIYRHTSAKLYGVCLRILKDRNEAEDVLHEVYVSLWRRARSYDEAQGRAIAWLTTVARNRAIDRLRSRAASRETATVDGMEFVDETPSAFQQVQSGQERTALERCLGELDERSRQAIRTAFYEGVTYEQLAARWDVPLGTMKSWIRRGMIRLRGCLET